MATVIPGALADHLTRQTIADAETVAVLDAARRGRGRTLVIEPTSTSVLHVISAYAEAILENRGLHTTAEARAARLWMQRVGHTPAHFLLPADDEQPQTAAAPAAEQPLVIIPCGATKLDHAAPAADLYVGSYHRACARAAAALTANGGTVLVLSALHGLVPLDRVLDPYNMRMGDAGSVTPELIREQARALGVDTAANVTILAGLAYATPALAVWPHATAPLLGLPGMGHHMRALAAIVAGEQAPAVDDAPALYAPRGLRNLTTGHLLDPVTGRAYCGIELAGRNGAAVLTCSACRHHNREQHLDAVEAEAAAEFAAATHAADAVEYAEQVEAGVATVDEAVALYDAYLAADDVRTAPPICPALATLAATTLDAALVDDEWRYAAALVTEAEATAGTWRGGWIGDTPGDEILFIADRTIEQGALFDDRATP